MQQEDQIKTDGPTMPAPYVPPILPRGLMAARYRALDAKVQEMSSTGADPKKVERVVRRRDQTKKEAKIAGGITQQQLNFQLLDEARNIAKYEKALVDDQLRLEQAKVDVEEAARQLQAAEQTVEATRQKLANSQARRAHLASTLAAETNADKHGGLHAAVDNFRDAVREQLPPSALHLWQQLEDLVRTVVPPMPSALVGDPLIEEVSSSDVDCDAATSVADEDGTTREVGDLILQSDLATAESDLQDLLKQQGNALALAVRTNESQGQVRRKFDSKIAEAMQRIQRTRALFKRASVDAGTAPLPADSTAARAPPGPSSTHSGLTPAQRAAPSIETQPLPRPRSAPRSLRPQSDMQEAVPAAAALPKAFATAERAASATRLAVGAADAVMQADLPLTQLTHKRREIRASLDAMEQRARRPERGRSLRRGRDASPRSRSERGEDGPSQRE